MRLILLTLLILSFPASASHTFDLGELDIPALQQRMAHGKDTSRSLVDKYIARIRAIDPKLHSMLEINPDAQAIAVELDAERKAGKVRGPMHGIPVLIKDNIATADKMETTAGSLALLGIKPKADSDLVASLRRAGAVILGKTNLSEWANMRSSHSSSGWSARGGQTRNPYALDRSPSGSSSGSCVAASANLAAVTIGTETDGSIVSPASINGVVGFKPTVGLVNSTGIIPISHSQDTAGPITRTVTDAAIVLTAIANRGIDYTQNLKTDGLKGVRIGVVRKGLTGYSPGADKVFEAAIADLKQLGAIIVDPADILSLDELGNHELNVLLYELKADMSAYLAWAGSFSMRSLQDLIVFNKTHAEQEMSIFDQNFFEQAQAKGPLTDAVYKESLTKIQMLTREKGIDAVMNTLRLDVLIAPTESPAWLIDHINGDSFKGGSSTPAAVAGYPHITVPAGFVSGLPVGISFFGHAWSESELIRFAYAYEQATKHRRAPRFLATAR